MAHLLGLTGGLASGKSTVARLLAERGCQVVDADRLVAELYRPGEPGAEAVRDLFGDEALDGTGAVDHASVAEKVFADPAERRRLEQAIHPLVRRRFEAVARAATEPCVVLEATLLVEAGFADDFDLVVTVEAPGALRLERAVARGLPEAAARARLEAQGEGDERRARADRVLVNDGTLEDLERQVDDLLAALAETPGAA
ncbi:MAG TPA: dephospho-CoA kinase [Thermoanaerobaculia bacterium]|nr:dephospho-CoA kinase [Thermoanaerobaculia bacterium]